MGMSRTEYLAARERQAAKLPKKNATVEYDEWYRASVDAIRGEVERLYRVVNTKGANKMTLVRMILDAKHGEGRWTYE